MTTNHVEPHWEIRDGIDVVVRGDDEVLVRSGDRLLSYRGLPVELLRALVAAMASPASTTSVLARLPPDVDRDTASALVEHLEGVIFRRRDRSSAEAVANVSTPELAIVVLGSGSLAAAIDAALRACHRGWQVSLVAAVPPTDEDSTWERIWPVSHEATLAPGRRAALERLTGASLVVVASEQASYGTVLDVGAILSRTRTPGLFVTADDGTVTVGPTFIPGVTACFECERRAKLVGSGGSDHAAVSALPQFTTGSLAETDAVVLAATAATVTDEVDRLFGPTSDAALYDAAVRLTARRSTLVHVPRDPSCGTCAGAQLVDPTLAESLERRALISVGLAADRASSTRIRASARPLDDGPRRVGILGGGTAGYLTALALRTRIPRLDVTLVESSAVPIIGVGEATTPRIVEFLHGRDGLDLDIVDFHRRVLPVWKLGVFYEWGPPSGNGFPWPFQYGSVHEALCYEGSLDDHCLAAMLMRTRRVPVFETGGEVVSRLNDVPFAYHLDNARFVRYLREEAQRAGVHHVDARVVDAELDGTGPNVAALVTADGQRLSFDLYVDCSGFRSVLLEQKLGSRYHSYDASLFTDAAVVANVPHDGTVKPFTLAETMDNGWCWNIAFEDEDHRGYVFASAFTSLDAAADEMMRKNPGMGDPWSLHFRSGRHEHFWKGNVVGVGNAYAFVEPLASTSIHMTLYALDLLIQNFPTTSDVTAVRNGLNRTLGEMWDSLRGWLAVQYRFNTRLSTPFWRECNEHVDLASARDKVDLFRERAPLAYASPVYKKRLSPFFLSRYSSDYFGQDYVYDIMLGGQQVDARWLEPQVPRDIWRETVKRQRAAVEWALPAAAALKLAREQRPDLLEALTTTPSFIGDELF